jgi:hypothetical protein
MATKPKPKRKRKHSVAKDALLAIGVALVMVGTYELLRALLVGGP